jgi:hypothetical protein
LSPLWWANCYKISQLLFAVVEAGLWNRLAQKPATVEELAACSSFDPGRLAAVLELLHRFALLERDGKLYGLRPGAEKMEPLMRLEATLQRSLASTDRIAAWLVGAAAADPLDQAPSDGTVDLFVDGFETFGHNVALHIWRQAGLADRHTLLDLGGAAGSHAAVLSRLSASLTFTIVDRGIMRRPFERRAAALGLESRMTFAAGDLRDPDSYRHLIAAHDAVLISNVLHVLSPERRQELCRTVLRELAPDSRLIIHDLFLDTADWQMSAFMSVDWMLLGADFSMTVEDCAGWLRGLGYRVISARALPGLPSGILVAAAEPAA